MNLMEHEWNRIKLIKSDGNISWKNSTNWIIQKLLLTEYILQMKEDKAGNKILILTWNIKKREKTKLVKKKKKINFLMVKKVLVCIILWIIWLRMNEQIETMTKKMYVLCVQNKSRMRNVNSLLNRLASTWNSKQLKID